MEIRKTVFADDEHGNSVMLMPGAKITEIEDAGPVEASPSVRPYAIGWNVTCRMTNNRWTEIVTIDAVKLLKALEG